MDGSSLLITGGLGLVGLTALGYVDHLRTNFSAKIDLTLTAKTREALPLTEFFGSEFAFLDGDLGDQNFLNQIPRFDYIIHAAGYGQPSRFMSDPASTLTLNSLCTIELRRKSNIGFLFVSSSEVYSGLEHSQITEEEIGTTNPSHPRAAYIEGKRFGEAASLVKMSSDVPLGAVARLSLGYGPGTRISDQRVLSELIVRGLTQGVVALRDSGERLRTYCYSEDAVEMLFGALLNGTGQVNNIGGHSVTSIRDLGEMIAVKLNVKFRAPEPTLLEDSSPLNVSIDVSKISKQLNKQEFVPMGSGIDKTIEWYRLLLR